MENLVKQRISVKSQLSKLMTLVNKHFNTPPTLLNNIQVKIGLDKVNKLSETLDSLHSQIIVLQTTDADAKIQEEVYEKLDYKCDAIRHNLLTIQEDIKEKEAAAAEAVKTAATASIPKINLVKLPQIELPVFDGNYEGWTSFQDLFLATIDRNQSLSGALKLQYLKSSLRGEAYNLIKAFLVTDLNYPTAWAMLSDRYDNHREIVTSILTKLFRQPVLVKECQHSLQQLLDTTNECIRALTVLGRPVDKWDDMLVYIVTDRMDPNSRRRWAMSQQGKDIVAYDKLSNFIEQHIRGLAASQPSSLKTTNSSSGGGDGGAKQSSAHHIISSNKCILCQAEHALIKCSKFTALTPHERSNIVKTHQMCYNCMRPGHSVKSCKSESSCKKCQKKHHTCLHFEKSTYQQQPKRESHFTESEQNTHVMLATAEVLVSDQLGEEKIIRVLLDQGSEASFITESCVKDLGLKRKRSSVTVTGLASTQVGVVRGAVQIKIKSRVNSESILVDALILPKVTNVLPKYPTNPKSWKHIQDISLADPTFHQPRTVDMLLGADVVASIMRDGIKVGSTSSPIAQNTIFGWILSGKVFTSNSISIQVNHANCESEEILRRFWELEETPKIKYFTPDEKICEDHFQSTHHRDQSGKYIVKLPFNSKIKELGESRNCAIRRWMQVEKRLSQAPERKQQYDDFMQEYIKLNHMEAISKEDLMSKESFYLPHHFVMKKSAHASKFRVVFDGSAKTTTGVSLNDCLYVGPTIQDDLFALLLRFRLNPIAMKADIKKMYRQFEVNKEDTKYQRIVWRKSADQPLVDYRLKTVTYGTAAAPFLATRCIAQLAEDEREHFPAAASTLIKDLYVDDFMGGAQDNEKAISLQQQLSQLAKKGNMEFCKWSSNSQEVMRNIPPELRELTSNLKFDKDECIKALGVQWNPTSDSFTFSVQVPEKPKKFTKRKMLSDLSKVFDPLGWLSPVTIRAKILFQDLWRLSIGWDDPLPQAIENEMMTYQQELKVIESISIPRCLIHSKTVSKQLHGFSDASEKAYSAVIYLRCIQSDGSIMVNIVTSKTKVAPVNQTTIPRLELCGSVLLIKLLLVVEEQIKTKSSIQAWTDSEIVLKWLAAGPYRWKTFVANRVSEILEVVPVDNWHHVISELNPADCGSRGISAAELHQHKLWWNGPDFLRDPEFPVFSIPEISKELPEEKKKVVISNHLCVDMELINEYETLLKLQRVTAYCFRFMNNVKPLHQKVYGELTPSELSNALNHWILHVQSTNFASELLELNSKKPMSKSSPLSSLNPYVDSNKIIRVGGRLEHAEIPEIKKHPIILPHGSQLTKLIVQHYHIVLLHAGPQLMLASIREKYWIIRAKDSVRHITRKCVQCRIQRAEVAQQLMGSLPSPRVNPGRPFIQCGVDYAGPYNVCPVRGRGQKSFKFYICLFVCLATKAIHLESVCDLSTEAFLAAFKRFISRRGICSDVYSDCGTNFVGADNEMQELLKSAQHNIDVAHQLADKGVNWHFNPPSAPHQGGLWEAGVKSVKHHLRRIVGSTVLSADEFHTILCQIEACLNSRPLCAQSSDPTDFNALTPGHFLIGQPLTSIPEPDLTTTKVNRLSRWQFVQQTMQHFWKRWSSEYLTSLQQRFKWKTKRENLRVHDLVLIKEDNLPPMKWKMGRILEVVAGKDDCVRVATIKTAQGELKRPIAKLCPLITNDDDD